MSKQVDQQTSLLIQLIPAWQAPPDDFSPTYMARFASQVLFIEYLTDLNVTADDLPPVLQSHFQAGFPPSGGVMYPRLSKIVHALYGIDDGIVAN